ncbi:excitatory amino acid transporter 1-like isoform X1 [Pecten maximus]|uniref:excitatory amino acid transporter 1-like isoform X1 n=1 Tax=Pecten maximus TaxID=6579 RepID=UPI001458DCD8|nr:excitatory amino acid transporter 1-like isoform X1 [Pecten maximus]XP_033737382.1 excitatory amino acid transporter 1-like isoform X1 [Pecten maximus]
MAAGDTLRRRRQFLTKCVRRNLLVILLIASMLFGIALGCVVRTMWSPSDTRNIFYLKFPGEIMLNTLKMVSVPLVVSSIISSLASLSMKTSGRIGLRALVYYLVTTVIAVITGTVGIVIISSGKETIEDTSEISKGTSQLDALLDMIRNAFPDNLVEATLSKKQSVLSLRNVEIPIKIAPFDFNHTNANVTRNGPRTVNFTTTDVIKVISIPGTNMLGLIVASIFIGCVLSSMEDKAKPLVDFFQSLYQAMMRLILIFVWFTPVGLLFLIAAVVVQIERPMEALQEFAVFIPTVLVCFLLHGFVTIPTMYFLVTRKNPFVFMKNMSRALVTAFGSSSSAAALPFTMDCLIRKNRIDERVVNFIAPIGATINMDGTALYIPMLTIFISHRLGLTLDAARYIIIGLSAIGVSVGAAAIPGSGLMYMTVAAMAVGLPVEQVILTAPFEWIIERFRTAINVSGDSFGAGIVNHLSYSMLTSEEVELQHTLTSKEEAAESNSLV